MEQEEEVVKGDKGKEEQEEKVVHIQMFVVGLVCQSVQV